MVRKKGSIENMTGEISQVQEFIIAWLTTEGLGLVRNLMVFALVVLAGMIVSKILRKTVDAAFERSVKLDPSPLLRKFAVNVTGKATMLMAVIIALGNLGIDTSALIAGIGVSGLVLGFALKDTLSNFASGLMILLYRPFDIGHFIELGSQTGVVKDLTLVSTVLTTPDNKQVNLPNSGVWGNPLTNFSATGTRRVDLVIGVAYDADIDETTEVLMGVLRDHELVMDDPEPVVRMRELNASSLDFNVRGWVQTSDYWTVHAELLREIKYRLDAAEIGIPFPQREIWMHQVSEPASEKRAAQEALAE